MLYITTKIQHKMGLLLHIRYNASNPSEMKFIFGGKLYRQIRQVKLATVGWPMYQSGLNNRLIQALLSWILSQLWKILNSAVLLINVDPTKNQYRPCSRKTRPNSICSKNASQSKPSNCFAMPFDHAYYVNLPFMPSLNSLLKGTLCGSYRISLKRSNLAWFFCVE